MMSQFIDFRSPDKADDGLVVVILGGILVSVLFAIGLAVDSGALYYGQLAAQSAADAAVSSGAALYAEQGVKHIPKVIDAMDKMARANLSLNRIPADRIHRLLPTIDSAAGMVEIQLAANIRLHILSWIPGFSKVGLVAASARAHVRPAVISLILDTSYSMCCRSGASACNPSDGCPLSGSRLEDLQKAVLAFIDRFDPQRDNINLIPFALGAEVLVPFRPKGQGFPLGRIQDEVRGLKPGGATNPSDAFLQSYLEAKRINAQKEVAYVYFSDGAPSAARFLFDVNAINPVNTTPFQNNILGFPWSNYDYLSWANYVGFAGQYVSLPYFFVYTPPVHVWNPRLHTEALPPPQARVVGKDEAQAVQSAGLFNRYLESITLRLPDGSSARIGSGWDGSTSFFHWERVHYREEYFNYALALADFARKEGGGWYAVGLGEAAGHVLSAAGHPDPYQNADQDFDRKDFFLTRLTNDSCGLVRGDPGFPGFPNFNALAAEGRREGIYLATPSSEELTSLFEAIARQIKMRLVE